MSDLEAALSKLDSAVNERKSEVDTVIAAIRTGHFDAFMTELAAAVTARKQMLKASANRSSFHELTIGDLISLTGVRPKYLNGAPGTVVGKGRERINVRLDQAWLDANPQAKARWSGVVRCPAGMIQRREA